jgi:hypothetical protein
VSIVARRHDLNANMLFTWRREAKQAAMRMIEAPAAFVVAEIASEPSPVATATSVATGRMEVVLPGGERAAIMYGLIVTAKLNDVDPQTWLAEVLARIAEHPASRLDELLPWNWKAASAKLAA